ncbi:MerR family transcriptional regulator [Pseudenhygromyxa sp. WMMC2535]|uniref:MerR family transcriptional regulator n=1 Tax=Pseudenhygromyxa sp. WMMC2535 TaxID=2712867 RepID=UPI001556698A|nr:MerR family transcriptional regulator [Pseudenhygromyxa sp. WMMC2535]NVB38032.1 MerR family transcriptional regulator [Pseudenhygromyxa sp. WMMC2535]
MTAAALPWVRLFPMARARKERDSKPKKRSSRRARKREAEASAPAVAATGGTPEPESEPESEPDEGSDQVEAGPEEEEAPSYTIDELAAHTGVPSRTIRFYQSSSVLPKPEKRGRVAYYGPEHVERLRLIGQLQDRGLRMRAIRTLVEQLDTGELALQEWLGLEEQLSSAWVDDTPQVLDRAALGERLGERRPGFLAELGRQGLVEARGDDAYLLPSPSMLQIALALEDAGVSLEIAAGAQAILARHLGKAASELAEYFVEHAGSGFGQGKSVAGVTAAFLELRSLGLEAVRLLFAREMEQVLRHMVETGSAARIDKKRRRRRG